MIITLPASSCWSGWRNRISAKYGTVAKLAMRQPFVLFKGLTFQKLCLP
ncbi:arsenical resistance protein ArsH, partial [Escherichia coli]|nr:arsenical resistance protein ArsH [Escherichia coli]